MQSQVDSQTYTISNPIFSIGKKAGLSEFKTEDGIIFYSKSRFGIVAAGEPKINGGGSSQRLWKSFEEKYSRHPISSYYTAKWQPSSNFKRIPLGTSTYIDLRNLSTQGHESSEIRRALNQGERGELSFYEVDEESSDVYKISRQALDLYENWLQKKGRPQIGFLLSPPKISISARCFYVLSKEGEMLAFASIHQSTKKSFYLDDMIQGPEAHRFALDFLISKLVLLLKSENFEILDLGLNAFADVRPKCLISTGLWLSGKIGWPYRADGLRSYKKKFNGKEVPQYLLVARHHSQIRQIISIIYTTYRPALLGLRNKLAGFANIKG